MKISIPLYRFNPTNITEDNFDANIPVTILTVLAWIGFIIVGSISFIVWEHTEPEAVRAICLFAFISFVGTYTLTNERVEKELE